MITLYSADADIALNEVVRRAAADPQTLTGLFVQNYARTDACIELLIHALESSGLTFTREQTAKRFTLENGAQFWIISYSRPEYLFGYELSDAVVFIETDITDPLRETLISIRSRLRRGTEQTLFLVPE